jgi:hypothetical protein
LGICDPSQENHDKLAQVIIEEIAKTKSVLFHFQSLFTHSKFDVSAPRRHRNMIFAAFCNTKQICKKIPNWRVYPGFLLMGHI